MKKNKSVLHLLGVIFFFSCISCAVGGDEITKEHIVKINGIEMYSGGAMNLLNRIIGVGESKVVHVVDENTGKGVDIATVTMVKAEMNIKIDDSELVKKVLRLFKKCSSRQSISGENIKIRRFNDNEVCIFEKDSGINLCINDSNQITKVAFY